MSREELDMAIPASFDAISEYYRENLKKIIDSDSISGSSIDSIEIHKRVGGDDDDDGSSTADSDSEDIPNPKNICANSNTATTRAIKNQISKVNSNGSFNALSYDTNATTTSENTIMNDNVQINSVAVNNSNDVHFGNKTFYNGPVTLIKQILIKDDYLKKKDDALGSINKAYEGSSTHINISHVNSPCDNNENNESTVQNSSGVNIKKLVIARKKVLLLALGAIICSITAVIAIIIYFNPQNEQEELGRPTIISRDEWNAIHPKDSLTKLESPVKRIVICHTVTDECFTQENCTEIVQQIQNMHLYDSRFKFSDIAYNFLIGGDGNVYEGRGWKDQGAHTSGYNAGSIGVAYIGNFIHKIPNDAQLQAGFKLFNEGVKVNALVEDYKIFPASQLRDTESPGKAFFEEIKKWKHWSEV